MSTTQTVTEAACAAYTRVLEDLERRREAVRREREVRDLEADQAALDMVAAHPWIEANLPGVEWKLVTRQFPQETACVCPPEDPTLWIIVTRGHADYVRVNLSGDPKQPLVGAIICRSLADLGSAIADRRRLSEHPPIEVD